MFPTKFEDNLAEDVKNSKNRTIHKEIEQNGNANLVNKIRSRGPQVCPYVILKQLVMRFWRRVLRFPQQIYKQFITKST